MGSPNADLVYKTQQDIVAELLAALLTRLPDANTGPDSIWRIWVEMMANTSEGLYLGMQLLHDDMFIQTMSALALVRAGEMYGRSQKAGVLATGSVLFSGAGGTYIPLGTVVSAPRPSLDDSLDFTTTQDGTVPNPGIPTACIAINFGAGVLTGTYEYATTFVTAAGETKIGAISTPLVLTSRNVHLTTIPIGGPGTTARNIYRRVNGGAFGLLTTLANNTSTLYSDNTAGVGAAPPTVSTAEEITITAQAAQVGTDYNVSTGTITDLSDAPAGLASVTNAAGFTGGVDEEDIEAFRIALLQWVRSPQSGGPNDLIAWATAIDGVESATVFPNVDLAGSAAPGSVSVRISATGGAVPGAPLIATVLAALQARDLANITILVGGFTANPISVTVTVTMAPGYVLADVTGSATAAIAAYITSVPVGGTVYKAGVIDAVFGLAGIVNVTSTFTDTTNTSVQKPTVGTITIS